VKPALLVLVFSLIVRAATLPSPLATFPNRTSGPFLTSPVITSNAGLTVASVSALPGAISGVWQVDIRIPANESAGGLQFSLSAGGVPVRDANLILWVQ
jgi:uncharacterized protein (TIGR03437 family)